MSAEARAAMVTGVRIYGVGMMLIAALVLGLAILLADPTTAFIAATPAFVMGCILMAGSQIIGFLGFTGYGKCRHLSGERLFFTMRTLRPFGCIDGFREKAKDRIAILAEKFINWHTYSFITLTGLNLKLWKEL